MMKFYMSKSNTSLLDGIVDYNTKIELYSFRDS